MSNFYCNVCKKKLSNNNDWQFHLKSKYHFSKVIQEKNKKETANSVSVAGLPATYDPEDVKALFTAFGSIDSATRVGKRVVLRFQTASSAIQALKKKVDLNGHVLQVSKLLPQPDQSKIPPREAPKTPQADTSAPLSVEKLQEILDASKSLQEQIQDLVCKTSLTPEDMDKRARVFQCIEQRLRVTLHPGCKVFPFGSSLTGLGMKGSDLDLFVEVPQDFAEQPWNPHSAALLPDVPVVNREKPILSKINRSLRSHLEFTDIIFIRARVPIVKFFHRQTAIAGDINVHNSLGWHNSRLLRYLTTVDSRVKTLMLLVRLWSKQFSLSGGNFHNKLSSYAWNMLVVSFLQQLEPPILPRIQDLQDAVTEADRQYVEDKMVSFSTNCPFTPGRNAFDVLELLRLFFHYMAGLDFANMVISPSLGKLLPKEDFVALFGNTPFKLSTALCVQDPIDLAHNVTSSFQDPHMLLLVGCCQGAVKMLQHVLEGRRPFWTLFHPPSYINLPGQASATQAVEISPPSVASVPCFWAAISPDLAGTVSDANIGMYENVVRAVKDYFVVGLGFDVEEEIDNGSGDVTKPTPPKRRRKGPVANGKVTESSRGSAGRNLEKSLVLSTSAHTWQDRSAARENCIKDGRSGSVDSYLAREAQISEYLKAKESNSGKVVLRISLRMVLRAGKVKVHVGCIAGSSVSSFAQFLQQDFMESLPKITGEALSLIECGRPSRK